MEIIEEFRDPRYSGLRLGRPGLNRMRELAQGSGFEAVLTWGPDRGARDSVLLDRILEEWAELGIRTLFLEGRERDEGLSPHTPGRRGEPGARGWVSERDRRRELPQPRLRPPHRDGSDRGG